MKHGFLAFKVINEDEREDFLSIVNRLHEDFEMNKSSDFYATELVALSLIKFNRAVKNDDLKASEAYDRMVRLHLSDLKATKSAREGDTVNVKTTPAEWASAILKRVNDEESPKRSGGDGAMRSDVCDDGGNDDAPDGGVSTTGKHHGDGRF